MAVTHQEFFRFILYIILSSSDYILVTFLSFKAPLWYIRYTTVVPLINMPHCSTASRCKIPRLPIPQTLTANMAFLTSTGCGSEIIFTHFLLLSIPSTIKHWKSLQHLHLPSTITKKTCHSNCTAWRCQNTASRVYFIYIYIYRQRESHSIIQTEISLLLHGTDSRF